MLTVKKSETNLIQLIESAWDVRETLRPDLHTDLTDAVRKTLKGIDTGLYRVCEKTKDGWHVNQWVKKAVILSFRLSDNRISSHYPLSYDKVPLKFENRSEADFKDSTVRVVPGAVVRAYSYIGRNVVLMPSFVNIGAYVDDGTMIDTWATVGSCVQVGKNCHISGGTGLGGVLEPLQANPVIIEDNCFIGARSEIVEGVIVEEGAVIGMGVFLGASTPIINRATGAIIYGKVPPYSVVIAGTLPGKPLSNGQPGPHLSCAVIIKQVDEKTRSKTSTNDLLRP